MSGIVGSYFNTRGSGIIAKLGTDGQVFTSTGAGLKQGFEAAAGGGAWNLIKSITASGDDDICFVNGASDVTFDGTYQEYIFEYINMHPATDVTHWQFQCSDDTGSSYGVNVTTNSRVHWTKEDGSNTGGGGNEALGNSTAFHVLLGGQGNDADQGASGYLRLYDPAAGGTFMVQFIAHGANGYNGDFVRHHLNGGYFHGGSAIDAIQFKFSSGTVDLGTVKMYVLT